MSRGAVSLADFFRALHELAPDEAAAGSIVRMLGLEGAFASLAVKPGGSYDPGAQPKHETGDEPEGPVKAAVVERPAPLDLGKPRVCRLETETHEIVEAERPAWLTDATVAELPLDTPAAVEVEPPPLFEQRRERAILGAALATRVLEGELDVDEIVRRRSRLEPLDCGLRLPIPSLRHGVQLLLDHGLSMTPYCFDRDYLARRVRMIAGRDRVSVRRFRGDPHRVFMRDEPDLEDWRPPSRSTVVAVVSDLGIGGPPLSADRAEVDVWLAFAESGRRAGCPVVAFVPFGPHRWDPRISRAMTLVHWSRTTAARALHRTFGAGHVVS